MLFTSGAHYACQLNFSSDNDIFTLTEQQQQRHTQQKTVTTSHNRSVFEVISKIRNLRERRRMKMKKKTCSNIDKLACSHNDAITTQESSVLSENSSQQLKIVR